MLRHERPASFLAEANIENSDLDGDGLAVATLRFVGR